MNKDKPQATIIQGNALQELKDSSARMAFGMTSASARDRGICLMCKKKPDLTKRIDRDEYAISALCGTCFDEITKISDEDA